MSMIAICDGCGRPEKARHAPNGDWLKPEIWYQRSDEDGIQLACSRQCIGTVAAKSGTTNVVWPL